MLFQFWPLDLSHLACLHGRSQQYGSYHEIAALAAIQQPTLTVFIGDHRQTPGGLSKGRAAAVNRRKLLQRPLGLRALDKSGDYLSPARMAALIAQLWPDASQDPESDLFSLLRLASRIVSHGHPLRKITSCLPPWGVCFTPNIVPAGRTQQPIAAALAVLLIATAPEEFGVPECTTTLKQPGYVVLTGGGIILPNSSRVSMLTYQAIVAVRYPELVSMSPITSTLDTSCHMSPL